MKNKWTCLHYAASYNHSETAKLLLQNGADLEARTKDGLTALDIAKKFQHRASITILERYEAVKRLSVPLAVSHCESTLNKDNYALVSTVERDDSVKWDSILRAVKENDLVAFTDLYDPTYLSNKDIETGLGILDLSVNMALTEILDVVLNEDINDDILFASKMYDEHAGKVLNHYNLYKAIRTRNEEIWNKWANVQIVNEPFIMTNESFLEVAVRYGGGILTRMVYEMILEQDEITWSKIKDITTSPENQSVEKQIKAREDFLKSRSLVHWNRLHVAVHDDRDDVVQYILSNQLVDPSLTDSTLNTPLSLALMLGHKECAKILWHHEEDPNRRNKFGQTMLHLAIESSMQELIDDIIERPLDLSRKDVLKFNVLTTSIVNGNKVTCEKILAKQKNEMTEYLKFDKSILEILGQLHTKKTISLTRKETYFSLCLKMNGELFGCLSSCLNKSMANMTDGYSNTLLHISSQMSLFDLCSRVINIVGPKSVNPRNKDGNTPLHLFLIQCDQINRNMDDETAEKFIKLYLDSGADILSRNNVGESIMQASLKLNCEKLFQKIFNDPSHVRMSLIEFSEILERNWFATLERIILHQNNSLFSTFLNRSTIIKLMENCSSEIINSILSSATVSLLDDVREELLIVAAKRGLDDIFERLLDKDIPEFKTLGDGETILTALLRAGKNHYCKRILSCHEGCGLVDQRSINGETALHLAADCQDMDMMEYFLLDSVHWDQTDNSGNSVLAILLKNISNFVESDKMKEIEKIIKIMIRGGQDINEIGQNGKPIIDNCDNMELRTKFQKFQGTVKPHQKNACGMEDDADKNICPICLDKVVNCVLQCGHPFCKDCLDKLDLCPSCREPIRRQQHLYL